MSVSANHDRMPVAEGVEPVLFPPLLVDSSLAISPSLTKFIGSAQKGLNVDFYSVDAHAGNPFTFVAQPPFFATEHSNRQNSC